MDVFGVFLIVRYIVCVILYANYGQCFLSLNWSTLFEHVLELGEMRKGGKYGKVG